MSAFGAGSMRAAASSKAIGKGVPLIDIMKAAGWTRASTFTKWYNKDVVQCKTVMEAVFE